jgi:hypothetical protein
MCQVWKALSVGKIDWKTEAWLDGPKPMRLTIGYEECQDDIEWDATRRHVITSELRAKILHEAGIAGHAGQYSYIPWRFGFGLYHQAMGQFDIAWSWRESAGLTGLCQSL